MPVIAQWLLARFIFPECVSRRKDHRFREGSASDNDLQWQAQLLANFSGHILVSSGQIPVALTQTVTECSLTILALCAEVSDLKLQHSVLISENKRLESELVYFLTRRLGDRSEFQSEIETALAKATIPAIWPSSLII